MSDLLAALAIFRVCYHERQIAHVPWRLGGEFFDAFLLVWHHCRRYDDKDRDVYYFAVIERIMLVAQALMLHGKAALTKTILITMHGIGGRVV